MSREETRRISTSLQCLEAHYNHSTVAGSMILGDRCLSQARVKKGVKKFHVSFIGNPAPLRGFCLCFTTPYPHGRMKT